MKGISTLGWGCLVFSISASAAAQGIVEPAPASEEELPDAEALAEMDLEQLLSVPVVDSVSLREQSILEAPASVTVISRDQIEASGANNLAELLRLVPGMHVMQLTANTYSVGLRGISRLTNDRVLILIDGHPYRDYATGSVRVGGIYLHPLDVERIEVIRGPGSVVYGAGALSGVINIVTRKAETSGTVDASGWGSLHYARSYNDAGDRCTRNGGGGRFVYNLRSDSGALGARLGMSINQQSEWPNADLPAAATARAVPIYGPHSYTLFATTNYEPSPTLRIRSTFYQATTEEQLFTDTSYFPLTMWATTQELSHLVEKDQFLVKPLDLSFGVTGRRTLGRPAESDVQSFRMKTYHMTSRLKLRLSLFEDRNITTLAGDAILARVEDFFYLPTTLSTGASLSNDTYLFDRKVVLSLAARADRTSSNDDLLGEVVYDNISYRGALIWHFVEDHAVRLSGASSYRVPSAMELFANVQPSSEASALPPDVPSARYVIGNPGLEPEQLVSAELGYRGKLFDKLHADVTVFGQNVSNLIDNEPEDIVPMYKINRFDYRQAGFELGSRLHPTASFSTYANYSFVYSMDQHTNDQVGEFPVHVGALGAEVRLPHRFRVNLDGYFVLDYRPDVSELTPDATMPLLTHERRRAAEQAYLNLRIGHLLWDDKLEAYVMGKNLLGFVRDPADLRMYPMSNVQPIGATVLTGLNLRSF